MRPRPPLLRLLQPKSIAVVGGHSAEQVIRQCDRFGFAGPIWPVNPHRDTMQGRVCFDSVADLPAAPDAAFVAVAPTTAVATIGELAALGAGGAVVYTAGFAETGEAVGQQRQADLQAAMGAMALVGPNCYGLLNYLDGVALWPDEHGGERVDRGVAVITQSGNISISLTMQQRGVPLAYMIATGNQAGETIPDYINGLLDDERVTVIGLLLEGLDDVVAFAAVAERARQQKVPIVALKIGSSALGSEAAMSHTSTLAGADQLYSALFERLGIPRVESLPQFLETLKFLAVVGPLPAPTIASISCSGGEAGLMADRAAAHGLTLPKLHPAQHDTLYEVLGDRVALNNPLDYHTYIWGDTDAQQRCFAAMMMGEQALTIKVLDLPREDVCDADAWVATAEAFARAVRDTGTRGAVLATIPENLPASLRTQLIADGIVPLQGLDDGLAAVRAAATVYAAHSAENSLPPLQATALRDGDVRTLDERASKTLLAGYGLRVPKSAETTAAAASARANEIGYPVVVKALGATLVHKSDVGGVQLNIKNGDGVRAAIEKMATLSDRFLIEQQAPKPLVELLVGLTRDPQFGLALVVGAGGVWVELLQDSQTLLLPTTPDAIATALDALRVAPLLNGYRGQPVADRTALITAIETVTQLAADFDDRLVELDINPLFVYGEGEGVMAVDAVIRLVENNDE